MSRRRVTLGALILVAGLGGDLFAQVAARTELPSDVMLGRLGLQRAWWAHATIDSTRDRLKYFISDERISVAQSETGMVSAFDNANGHRLWTVQIGDPHEVRFRAVTNDHLVLIISGADMYALNKFTGDVAWTVKVPTAVSTPPGLDETRAYVGSVTGAIYAYDLVFLEKLSKDPRLAADMYHALKWQYKTGARIMYQPISTGKVVIVASADASLYGLDAANRRLHFQFETDQPLSAPITQIGKLIFVATDDRKAYCLDAESGALKWELLSGLRIRQTPRVVEDFVYLRPDGYGLRCLSVKTGVLLWSNRQALNFLAATPAVVYATDALGNVLLLNPKDGRQIGAFSMRQFPLRVANERTDRLYMASDHGLIVCIRERDRDLPLFHKSPEKGPILPEVAPDQPDVKPAAGAKKPSAGKKKTEDEDAAAEEKKENGNAAPADENSEKPAAKPAVKSGKPAKPVAKPDDSDNQ
jgi:outer membrane protein assembly factor BamB